MPEPIEPVEPPVDEPLTEPVTVQFREEALREYEAQRAEPLPAGVPAHMGPTPQELPPPRRSPHFSTKLWDSVFDEGAQSYNPAAFTHLPQPDEQTDRRPADRPYQNAIATRVTRGLNATTRDMERINVDVAELQDRFRWSSEFVLDFMSMERDQQMRAMGELLYLPNSEEDFGEYFKRVFPRTGAEAARSWAFIHPMLNAAKKGDIYNAARRIEAGVDDVVDRLLLLSYIRDTKREGTWPVIAAEIGIESARLFAEFAMTAGVFEAPAASIRGAVSVGIKQAMNPGRLRHFARVYGARSAGVLGGAAVQSVLSPRLLEAGMTLSLPQLNTNELDELLVSFDETNENFENLFGVFVNNFIMYASERSGGAINEAFRPLAALGLKIGLVQRFVTKFPKNRPNIARLLKEGGWNNVGELGEEVVEDLGHLAEGELSMDEFLAKWQDMKQVTAMMASMLTLSGIPLGASMAANAYSKLDAKRANQRREDQLDIMTTATAAVLGRPVRIPNPSGPTVAQNRAVLLTRGGPYSLREQELLNVTDSEVQPDLPVQYSDIVELPPKERQELYEQLVTFAAGQTYRSEAQRREVYATLTMTQRAMLQNGEQMQPVEPGLPWHGPVAEELMVRRAVAQPAAPAPAAVAPAAAPPGAAAVPPTPQVREGLEYERQLFPGEKRFQLTPPGPVLAGTVLARANYNKIRTDLGLPEVTDWTKLPEQSVGTMAAGEPAAEQRPAVARAPGEQFPLFGAPAPGTAPAAAGRPSAFAVFASTQPGVAAAGAAPAAGPAPAAREGRDRAAAAAGPPRAFTRGSRGVPEVLHVRGRDVPVVARFDPSLETSAVMAALDIDAVPIYEITGQVGAEFYSEFLADVAARDKYGAAVEVKSAESLAKMRLFITENGLAGAVLDGIDMVAVAKAPEATVRGWGSYVMLQMITEGGRTCDCFDTVLPGIYAIAGLRVVSRMPWNDALKPPNWNYDTFKKWNNGRPDFVMLAWSGAADMDPLHYVGIYDYAPQRDGRPFGLTDYDDAKRHQLDRLYPEAEQQAFVLSVENLLAAGPPYTLVGLNPIQPADRKKLQQILNASIKSDDSPEGFILRMQATALLYNERDVYRLVAPEKPWQRGLQNAMKALGVDITFFTDGPRVGHPNSIGGANDPGGRRIGIHIDQDQRQMVAMIFAHEWAHYLRANHKPAWIRFHRRIKILDPMGLRQAGIAYYMRQYGPNNSRAHMESWLASLVGIDEAVAEYLGQNGAAIGFYERIMTRDQRTLDLMDERLDEHIAAIEQATAEAEVLGVAPKSLAKTVGKLRAMQDLADASRALSQTQMQTAAEVNAHSTEVQRALRGPDPPPELEAGGLRLVTTLGRKEFDAAGVAGANYDKAKTDINHAAKWARAVKKKFRKGEPIAKGTYDKARRIAAIPRAISGRAAVKEAFEGEQPDDILVQLVTGRDTLDITPTGPIKLDKPTVIGADFAGASDAKYAERGWKIARPKRPPTKPKLKKGEKRPKEPKAPPVIRDISDEQKERLVTQLLQELRAGIASKIYDGSGWYNKRVERMLFYFSKRFPELLHSPSHAAVFKYLTAVTSNGNKVDRNLHAAFRIYSRWRKSALDEMRAKGKIQDSIRIIEGREVEVPQWGFGKFPTMNTRRLDKKSTAILSDAQIPRSTRKGQKHLPKHAALTPDEVGNYLWSVRGWTMRDQLLFLNRMMQEFPVLDEFVEWLMEPMTVGEIRQDPLIGRKQAVAGENKDLEGYRVLFLGPKLGAFFLNMMGVHELLTMDVWFARTWNRLCGTLMDTAEQRAEKLLAAHLNIRTLTEGMFNSEAHGFNWQEVQANQEVAAKWAKAAYDAIQNRNGKTRYKRVNSVTKRMVNAGSGVVGAPGKGAERKQIREVFDEVLARLPAYADQVGDPRLASLKMSDIQAILWYAEQALWNSFGASKSQTTSEDFADVAERIIRQSFGSKRRRRSAAGIAARSSGRGGSAGAGAAGSRQLVSRMGAPTESADFVEFNDAEVQDQVRRSIERENGGIDSGLLDARYKLIGAGFSNDDAAELVRLAAIDVLNTKTRMLSHAIDALATMPKGQRNLERGTRLLAGLQPLTGQQKTLFLDPAAPEKPDQEEPGPGMTAQELKGFKSVLKGQRAARAEGERAGKVAGKAEERVRGLKRAREILDRLIGPVGAKATQAVLDAQARAAKAQKPEQVTMAAVDLLRAQAAQARRELARTQVTAARIEEVRNQIREAVRSSKLPQALHGRFLGDIVNARTPTALMNALTKIELLGAQVRFNHYIDKLLAVTKQAKKAGKKILSASDRTMLEYLRSSAQAMAFVGDTNRPKTFATPSEYDNASVAVSTVTAQMHAMLQARQDELKDIKADKVRTRNDAIAQIQRNLGYNPKTGRYRKQITGTVGRYENHERRWLKRGVQLRAFYNTETQTRMAERRWRGDGVLTALLSRNLKLAESRYNMAMRDEWVLLNQLVHENLGYAGLSEAMMRMSGNYGDASLKRVTVFIAGRDIDLPIDIAAEILALDDNTLDKIDEGRPITFEEASHRDPLYITLADIHRIRAQLRTWAATPEGTGLQSLVDALKARLETQIRPQAFAVHMRLNGWEPEAVAGYWPTFVDASGSPELGLAQAFREGGGANSLLQRYWENAGFLQARTEDAKAPYMLRGLLKSYLAHIDHALKVVHLAEPVRDAAAVVLNPTTRSAISAVHGRQFYETLRHKLLVDSLVNRDTVGGWDRWMGVLQGGMVNTFLQTNFSTWFRVLGGMFKVANALPIKHMLKGFARLRVGQLDEMMASPDTGYFWDRWNGSSYARFSGAGGIGMQGLDHLGFGQSIAAMLRSLAHGDLKGTGKSWARALRALKFLDWFDGVIARVAWGGFQSLAEEQGQDAAWAAFQTELAMRGTQNSSSEQDQAAIISQSKNSLLRWFFLFTSDSIASLNMLVQSYHQGPKAALKASALVAANILWSSYVTILAFEYGSDFIAAAIGSLFGLDDDKKRKLAIRERSWEKAHFRAIRDTLGTIPVIGDVIAAAIQKAATGSFGQRGFQAPLQLVINNTFIQPLEQIFAAIEKMDEEQANETWTRIFDAVVDMAREGSTLVGNPFLMPYYKAKRIADPHARELPPAARYFLGLDEEKKKKGKRAGRALVPGV